MADEWTILHLVIMIRGTGHFRNLVTMSNNYSAENIATMELIYGEGYLSAGGDDEVAAIVDGVDLAGKSILDLGCGLGGASVTLARDHRAGSVTGVDIDSQVLERAAALVRKYDLESQVVLQKIEPGLLPFEKGTFDLVYLTAVTCHLLELRPFLGEVKRVLKAGAVVAGCEWLKLEDNASYRQWDRLLRERGLNFHFVDRHEFVSAFEDSGFEQFSLSDRTGFIHQLSQSAVNRVQGELKAKLTGILGDEGYETCLDWTRTRARAFAEGGIGQGHFRARTPG